jgi:S1-C subfamily serine protease
VEAPEPLVKEAPDRNGSASLPPAELPRPARHRLPQLSRNALLAIVLAASAGLLGWQVQRWQAQQPLTLKDIDQALRVSLQKAPLPSFAAAAYRKIIPSVVRVEAFSDDEPTPGAQAPADGPTRPPTSPAKRPRQPPPPHDDDGPSVGTGVVIQDNGTILTNLHVVEGARRLKVHFHDGLVADALVLSADRKQDLAVIRASQLPDDLQPATLRGTADLRPGDHVVAVGFPFGIGPSTSAGVVSGLEREFRTPGGGHTMRHLIQFDAAANPGNSGGPLVTQQGEVVGIVTAILNPTSARTFIGIGFAVPIENAAAAAGMPPF